MGHEIVDLKTIGLLGGMSTEATAEYYRLINDGVNRARGGHHVAEIMLCSVNFQNIERFIREGKWGEAGTYLARKARQLEAGGAQSLFMATNTMHRVRAAITEAVSIPFVDIIEVTARAIRAEGLSKVGLLGTLPVMTDPFFQEAYAALGVETVTPGEEDKKEVDRVIFEELCHHMALTRSKHFFLDVIRTLQEGGAEGVILGCTEIKSLLSQDDCPGFPVFDTTILHCEAAVRWCLGEGG
jgi:aspartate racemase